jgi:hypothetical protein
MKRNFKNLYMIKNLELISKNIKTLDLKKINDLQNNYINFYIDQVKNSDTRVKVLFENKSIDNEKYNQYYAKFSKEYSNIINIVKAFDKIQKAKVNHVLLWSFFNIIAKKDYKKIIMAEVKSLYLKDVGKIKQRYTYDGDFDIKKSAYISK